MLAASKPLQIILPLHLSAPGQKTANSEFGPGMIEVVELFWIAVVEKSRNQIQ